MVVGRVIITAIRDTKIAIIVVAKMVAISVALAIGLDIAGAAEIPFALAIVLVAALIGVYGRIGDTVSPLRPAPLCLLPLLYLTKNFTANNLQQTHYQHEHTNETFERYLYSYD